MFFLFLCPFWGSESEALTTKHEGLASPSPFSPQSLSWGVPVAAMRTNDGQRPLSLNAGSVSGRICDGNTHGGGAFRIHLFLPIYKSILYPPLCGGSIHAPHSTASEGRTVSDRPWRVGGCAHPCAFCFSHKERIPTSKTTRATMSTCLLR